MSADASTEADQAAIDEVMFTLASGFRELDASEFEAVYVEDADWTNAFGTVLHGRANIVSYLRNLFADPHFAAGKPVGPPQASIRFASPDVALVKTYIEREGQQTADGDQLPVRRNHSLKVLVKRDGRWLILAEMYMDARDATTLARQG
jgi:uncharacterized protein (TIGR02246 family)